MCDIKSSEGSCFVSELHLFIPGIKSSKFLTLAILPVCVSFLIQLIRKPEMTNARIYWKIKDALTKGPTLIPNASVTQCLPYIQWSAKPGLPLDAASKIFALEVCTGQESSPSPLRSTLPGEGRSALQLLSPTSARPHEFLFLASYSLRSETADNGSIFGTFTCRYMQSCRPYRLMLY